MYRTSKTLLSKYVSKHSVPYRKLHNIIFEQNLACKIDHEHLFGEFHQIFDVPILSRLFVGKVENTFSQHWEFESKDARNTKNFF